MNCLKLAEFAELLPPLEGFTEDSIGLFFNSNVDNLDFVKYSFAVDGSLNIFS